MRATRLRLVVSAALAIFALAACGGNGNGSGILGGGNSPTNLPSLPTNLPSLPTNLPTNLPSLPTNLPSLPTGGGGTLSKGTAHVEFSTGESGDISLSNGTINAGNVVSLAYIDSSSGSTLTMGGLVKEGDNTTSQTLALVAALPGDNGIPNGFTSLGGECTISISSISDSSVEGSFSCKDATAIIGNGKISATGNFSASA